ncbi:predicted protein [Histoplasma capsulatum G186AR]|uniref:Uncharacterized protein n=1 Tax=Ajellomyces capsulatus (strain G186AR / H82 / ATCC MYA-2454 / RMSCC 2432) TaxID=447093 RepID=C0NFQ4_AJECG|nr:uncharacterized protein HCBG_01720 [Histoplasma capsulatum G186AR]EEH10075.1 predicted protein [Histoplasma capsulatum G186AR]
MGDVLVDVEPILDEYSCEKKGYDSRGSVDGLTVNKYAVAKKEFTYERCRHQMAQNTSSTEKSHFTTFFQAYIVYQTEVGRLFERDDDKTKNENAKRLQGKTHQQALPRSMNHREPQRNQLNNWRMTVVLSGKSRFLMRSRSQTLLLAAFKKRNATSEIGTTGRGDRNIRVYEFQVVEFAPCRHSTNNTQFRAVSVTGSHVWLTKQRSGRHISIINRSYANFSGDGLDDGKAGGFVGDSSIVDLMGYRIVETKLLWRKLILL